MRRIRIKLSYLFVALLVVVSTVPLFFYGHDLIALNRDALRTKEREFQSASTRDLAEEIGVFQRSTADSLDQLTNSVVVLSNGNLTGERVALPEMRGLLEQLVKSSDRLLYVSILNLSNQGVTAARVENLDVFIQNAIDRAYLISRAGGTSYQPLSYAVRGRMMPVLLRSQPVRNGDSVIGVAIQLEDFGGIQRRLDDMAGGGLRAFVVDTRGRLVAEGKTTAERSMGVQGQDLSTLEIVRRFVSWQGYALASETTSYAFPAGGAKVAMLATYAAVPQLQWGVIAQRPESEAFAAAEALEREGYLLMLLSAMVSIAVGLYCSTLLTRPLQLLTAQAHALARREQYGHISVRNRTEIGDLARSFNKMADEIEHYITELKLAAQKNRDLFLGSIRLLAQAVDEKDPYTRGHSDRVARYSSAICDELNLSLEESERISISAQLHDVGKIVIDDVILKKTTKLTAEEFNIMKQHTTKGANIVRQVEQLRDVVPGIELHHEFLDGTGYPHGYRDEQIPLMAKIIAVADTFDAMTTLRPYQKPLQPSEVVRFIQSKAGIRYAPEVVAAFVAAWEKGAVRNERGDAAPRTMTPAEAVQEAMAEVHW